MTGQSVQFQANSAPLKLWHYGTIQICILIILTAITRKLVVLTVLQRKTKIWIT